MKEKLLGLAAGVMMASCATFSAGGAIDLAYVPNRTDDKVMINEIKLGLKGYVDMDIEDVKFRIGGAATTYMNLPTDDVIIGGFNPTRISYDIYAKIFAGDLEFYAFHNCTHPVKGEEFWLQDKDNNYYIINHDSRTELGVKLKF